MAHCTNSLHCGSRLTSSLEKAVRCSSLSSPDRPHPPGMVMVPCPAPCGSGWGGCGWVGMLVDGVVVFANDVESYGICKELDLVRE